jgi:alcohol dehydrogenase YqhD (iron-dependent ADH family)
MRNFTYNISTKVLFGDNAIDKVGNEVRAFAKKILIVYGSDRIKKNGLLSKITTQLDTVGIQYIEHSGIKPNPTLESVETGIDLIKKHELGFILAVGGGSVIDASKAMAAGAAMGVNPWDFCMRKMVVDKALPIGTVLTLSATGSEMNGNSVISNTKTGEKRAFGSDHTRPKFSVLDPTLTFSLPKNQTSAGVVDIFTHVCEQYFDITNSAAVQDRLAEAIMKVCIDYGKTAIDEPENYEARANLMWASSLALNGLLNYGKRGGDWATHAIEHEISAVYDITHGLGLAIVLSNWMRYVLNEENAPRFAMLAKNVFGIQEGSVMEQALAGIEAVVGFFKSLEIETSLSEIGLNGEHFEKMAGQATHFGSIGGYYPLEKEDVLNILNRCINRQ